MNSASVVAAASASVVAAAAGVVGVLPHAGA